MTTHDTPATADLPTLRQLNRATLFAAAAAAVILVTTVLPAEYGVDPTGIGRVLGLTPMGEMKRGAVPGAPVTSGNGTTILPDGATQIRITLRPYGGKEVKAVMKAGDTISYSWSSGGVPVEFEFHGDAKNRVGDEYSSYEKGTSTGANGTFKAGFEGNHGWYWHNLTPKPLVITVSAKGQFETFAPLD